MTTPESPRNNDTLYLFVLMILGIEVTMILLAFLAICGLNKSSKTTPVYVINLLIADFIHIVSMALMVLHYPDLFNLPSHVDLAIITKNYILIILAFIWLMTIMTNLYFMTCIAIERYTMIAHPIWYRSHHSNKCPVCTLVTGWLLPFISILLSINIAPLKYLPFIPFPVIIVCFALMCRFLFKSTSLTSSQKWLSLAPLFLLLISYTFIFIPLLFIYTDLTLNFELIVDILYLLKPLVDCVVGVLMMYDVENIICMPLCCCKPKTNQSETQNTMITIDEQGGLNDTLAVPKDLVQQ